MSYPATARAVLITAAGGPEVLQVSELPVADPGPGEVVVRIRAAGVNPVDAKIRRGTRGAITEPIRIGRTSPARWSESVRTHHLRSATR